MLDHFGDSAGRRGRWSAAATSATRRAGCPTPRRSPSAAPRSAKKAAAAPIDLTAADAPLFEQLKDWRLRAADGKPAFTVAHNSTLEAIAATRPANDDALLAIRGIGPSFVSKYAAEVLAIVDESQHS